MTLSALDLAVMAAYAVVLVGLGLWFARRASRSETDYFASGRSLPWWVAGTSMIAASFASDTPLLVCGYVRTKGVWGNWAWWALGTSTVLSTFLFSRLWHRSGVLTETELSEARYAGRNAAVLRGFKAVFWGLVYASYAAGAGAVTGLSKMTEATLGWHRTEAILVCAALAAAYVVASGLWGVVATDVFQFAAAIVGALATAFYALKAAGGLDHVLASLPAAQTALLPPLSPQASGGFWSSPLSWFLAFAGVQWWAWKNSDGGGVLVQRMAACRSERHAVGATLWYAVGHYALRAWPWVMVALASLVLFPVCPDPEAAYGKVVAAVLPAGVRGFVLAWFLAEFMTGVAQFANFGASLLVHDGWRRFLRPGATEREVLRASRLASLLVIAGAVGTAFFTDSVGKGFEMILKLTAGVGTVYLARWLWWRVNAVSEIAALAAAIPAVLLAPWAARRCGIPGDSALFSLLFVIGSSVAVWLLATFLTPPEDRAHLVAFYRKVRPPRWGWGPVAAEAGELRREPWGRALRFWMMGTAGIYLALFGLGGLLLDKGAPASLALLGLGAVLILVLVRSVRSDPV